MKPLVQASLGTIALLILYADAVLRVINGLFGDGFGPLLEGPVHTFRGSRWLPRRGAGEGG